MRKSNRTRRVDSALFMVAALNNDALIREAPALVGCNTPRRLPTLAAYEISVAVRQKTQGCKCRLMAVD